MGGKGNRSHPQGHSLMALRLRDILKSFSHKQLFSNVAIGKP
jgi:hypothetical protein